MLLIKAARIWLASVVACVGVLAAWIAAAQLLAGRMSHVFHNMVDVSLAFGAVFAVVAAVVHVPVFIVLSALLADPLRRAVAILVGVGLAPAVFLAVGWRFREFEAANLPELVSGSLPFAVAGAVFGMLWSRGPGRVSRRVERAV